MIQNRPREEVIRAFKRLFRPPVERDRYKKHFRYRNEWHPKQDPLSAWSLVGEFGVIAQTNFEKHLRWLDEHKTMF